MSAQFPPVSMSPAAALPIRAKTGMVVALYFIVVALSTAIRAADYVEITTEVKSTWHSSTRTNQFSNRAKCVVGANDWFISGDFLRNAHVEYWLVGTNVVERKVITSNMYGEQLADIVSEKILGRTPVMPGRGYPRKGETFTRIRSWLEQFGYGEERLIWLAFCSGAYLKHDGRKVPMPFGHVWEALGYSDKTVVFEDILGLPRSVELYATNGQVVCKYEVRQWTNLLGRNFPVEFRLVQQGTAGGGTVGFGSGYETVGRVTSIQLGNRPTLPDEVRKELERKRITE